MRSDNADMEHKLNHLNHLVNKYKGELIEKENMMGKSYQENDHEVAALKQQIEAKRQENIQLTATIRDIPMQMKEAESEG